MKRIDHAKACPPEAWRAGGFTPKQLIRLVLSLLGLAGLIWGLAACAQPASPTHISPTLETTAPGEPTAAGTTEPEATATAAAPTPVAEARRVELEWPGRVRLGESDVVRLALIPFEDEYMLSAEFPDHQVQTQPIQVPRPGGYDLFAAAQLDAVTFEVSPEGKQVQWLPPDEPVSWQWSLRPRHTGRQRISVTLFLRWEPISETADLAVRESTAYSRGLDVQVSSFFGLSQRQALFGGLIGVLLGGGLTLLALIQAPAAPGTTGGKADIPLDLGQKRSSQPASAPSPRNPNLAVELPAHLELSDLELSLLQRMFGRYARLILQDEFLSGYSGARAFLARPVRMDGRADAHTIIKIGTPESIQREFENYETYVKDTLPPVTARIQDQPVVEEHDGGSKQGQAGAGRAAIRYTFIGEAGSRPQSLRQALLTRPDPGLLQQLFDTFGPQWWLQRRPYSFRMAVEYDRVLPTHLVIKPVKISGDGSGQIKVVDGRRTPGEAQVQVGDIVRVRGFPQVEPRAPSRYGGLGFAAPTYTLIGQGSSGQPPVRVRWLGAEPPGEGAAGRVAATRLSLLQAWTNGFDRLGLPDPLLCLPALLDKTITGTLSTIHGDLNLENALIGPGGMVWLIDFAMTRDGHTLFDFAHLEAQLIAHIIATKNPAPEVYAKLLEGRAPSELSAEAALLAAVRRMVRRCLFDPDQMIEYELALILNCLGAQKFENLDEKARELLFLTAAFFAPDKNAE